MRSPTQRWLLMALATVALTLPLLLPGGSLYRWDSLLYSWPMALETRSQLLSGHWPFWAGSFCNGTPLLENINAGVLYPLRALIWLLPLRPGYAIFLAAHVLLAMAGMELLLRRGIRIRGWGPLAGALIYAASGYARGMWDTHNFVALPWLPLGLAALLEARRPGRFAPGFLGVALSWALLVLSGDLQAACLWVPAAGLLALFHRERARLVASLACGIALGLLLSAIQWLPAWVAAQESYRAGGLDLAEAMERSFHPVRLLDLLLPYVFGTRDSWAGAAWMGEGAVRLTPWTASLHLGVVSLVAIALALRRPSRPGARWAACAAAGSLLLSFGRFLPGYAAWQSLPLVSAFRYPEKYLLWTTLALAVLAGSGFSMLQAWGRVAGGAAARAKFLRLGALALLALGGAGFAIVRPTWPVYLPAAALWLFAALTLLRAARGSGAWLAFALAAGLLGAWCCERPVTRAFDPLRIPFTLEPVKDAGPGGGRALCDPAVQEVPLPPGYANWRPTERQAEYYRETWTFNSPVLWGIPVAGGFSPAESGAMRAWRLRMATPPSNGVPGVARLAEFCRKSAVEWLLTTPSRLADLRAAGLPAARHAGWGQPDGLVVARVQGVSFAEVWTGATIRVREVWRPRAGFMRIDLASGGASWLRVSETFGRGWRAADQQGRPLKTAPLAEAFLGVEVAPGTRQIRLQYQPVAWNAAWRASAAGLAICLGIVAWRRRARLASSLRGPWWPAAVAVLLAAGLGLSARSHWACTFDEGFHVARGIALRTLGDSRLSYFHPPVQNLAAGYFADLAWGHALDAAPDAPGWREADVQAYSVALAARNRDRFPDLVQAARWGSLLFYLLLCLAGVRAAHAWGGPLAAWLAAAGLALQPSLLAHGHLATTDMGIAALATLGTLLLYRGLGKEEPALAGAVLAFTVAAAAKHSGLIWLGALLLVVVPAVAVRRRKPRLLLWIPAAVLLLAGLLVLLYGPAPQAIRYGLRGELPAGRFIEGLARQSDHALSGHRGYLAGSLFLIGAWWHAPLTLLLKTPVVWCAAALWSLPGLLRRWRNPALWAFVPALAFTVLLMFAGKLSLGVRHLLPLLALGVIGGSVAVARMHPPAARKAAASVLLAGSLLSALVWPNFLSFVPAWAGGVAKGPRWVLDSNFDWGQEAGVVEENWASLTEANGSVPPTLYYFGFLDPAYVYRLPVGPGSYLGFMRQGPEVTAAVPTGRVTVASVSATGLNPHGLPLAAVTNGLPLGALGTSYRLYRAP